MAVRISFLGDITCDRPMLKAARTVDGKYDFSGSLSSLREILQYSDYVVGNLETVFAGEKLGYNPGPITYNSPDSFLSAVKDAGVTMLTTANNHCLDCGRAGIDRTIEQLDAGGIEHTGTYHSCNAYGKNLAKNRSAGEQTDGQLDKSRFVIRNLGGLRVAFVSFTDSINTQPNGVMHSRRALAQVNLLRNYKPDAKTACKQFVKCLLPMEKIKEYRARKERENGVPLVHAFKDDFDVQKKDKLAIENGIDILKEAKQQADFVIVCVHCGGQFNDEPGKHSVRLFDMIAPYADAIIGNHAHVVQKVEKQENIIRAYSLGGLNMSPSADYIHHENLPNYSVVLNLFIEKNCEGKAVLQKSTFSILRAEENENQFVSVRIADITHEQEIAKIYERFTGQKFEKWNVEYEMWSLANNHCLDSGLASIM